MTANAWPTVALGDLLTKSERWVEIDPARRYKQITVRLWGQGVALRNQVSGSEIGGLRRLRIEAGQFIISRIDARNGAMGVVPPPLDGGVVSNDFPVFDVRSEAVLTAYLHWLSRTGTFVRLCKAASEGTTNRVRLKEERFLSMTIPLPPLDEQRRIVARIEQLAVKIGEARGLRRQAAQEAEALVRSALVHAIQAVGIPAIPLEEACAAIVDNLHTNPNYSWDGVPCVRSPDVGWGSLHLAGALKTSEEEFLRRTVRGRPMPGDVVLVREGGGTGKAALVREGERFSLGQRVMMLRPDVTKVLPKFFLYQLISPLVYDDQIVPLSKGSASPHLNIGALRKFCFRLPALAEQRRIVAYLDGLQDHVDALKRLQAHTAAELDALLPSVLDRAFKGEL
jgi:type I restriction enzyme S subunit